MTTSTKDSATLLEKVSWMPMVIILMAQIQMAFNVNALPVSIGPISEELNAPATAVGTALVVYSLFVAAFVMVGAKIGKRFGSRLIFQVGVVGHGAAMGLMAISTSESMMVNAQAVAGLAAALLVPTLVVLTAVTYQGKQQAQALGLIAAAPAVSGVLAFLVAGYLGTALSWRYSFGLLVVLAAAVLVLSFRLKPVERYDDVKIDGIGAILAALGVILISFGANNLNSWGVLLAGPGAPFDVLGLSPAPVMIVMGILLGQAFFAWSRKVEDGGNTALFALQVIDSTKERAALYTMLIIGALGPAVNFLIPLYIQIVQGRTSLQTSVAVVPYTLAIASAAVLVVRLYDRLSPRAIGTAGFILVTAGLTMLAFTIGNDWGTPLVILSLITLGLGEGALLTLLFNVLVTSSPKKLAGDVGALRGTANNLSTAIGTALAGAISVGLLALAITTAVTNNPGIPQQLINQVNLNNINFLSNDQLLAVLSETTATPEQVTAAVAINAGARLRALQATFLILAAVALLAIIPARNLPNYTPRELTADDAGIAPHHDDPPADEPATRATPA
jgi:MFS family permease